MSGLERRCRFLLRAYPAWYRRERAGEMLDVLLQATAPGRGWPSWRDARSLVLRGLRVRGWARCLAVVWAALGAFGAGYLFVVSLHVPAIVDLWQVPTWNGESGFVTGLGEVDVEVALVLLTVPVLVAGLVRLRGRHVRAGVWAGAWAAGAWLMWLVYGWSPSAPNACPGEYGCPYTGVAVSWSMLVVCAGWLVLGAVFAVVLARPVRRGGLAGPGRVAGS